VKAPRRFRPAPLSVSAAAQNWLWYGVIWDVHPGLSGEFTARPTSVDKSLQASYAEQTYLATLAVNEKCVSATEFGNLRQAQKLTLRVFGSQDRRRFTYFVEVENEKLDFADYPSDDLIVKLANALDADADELLIMAKKIPAKIKKRFLERPDAFRKLAGLDDETLDRLLQDVSGGAAPEPSRGYKPRASKK